MDNEINIQEFENALEDAKKESEAVESLVTINFKRTVKYKGETIESLDFDFDKLTGKDAENIENECRRSGNFIAAPAMQSEYIMRAAAKACTRPIGVDLFDKISINDYNKIRSAARNFLLESE